MSRGFPAWSYPFILALLGIVLFFGHLSRAWQGAIGGESVGFIAYLIARAHWHGESHAVANLISLFPGHLLLLFGIGALSPPPGLLLGLWMIIPAASVIYDVIGIIRPRRGQTSTLAGIYCIIWADLFFLLERIINLGRGLSSGEELIVAAVFVGVGAPFLGIGVYRHVRMSNR